MKNVLFLLGAVLLLAGCQSSNAPTPTDSAGPRTKRNNCYSLLHQLLAEEKDVSLLRFIKREDDDVKILVNKIAKFSGTNAKLLEEFAKQDPSLFLEDIRLPVGEVATRDAIGNTKQHELLHSKGDDFRLALLLTQSEALNYGRHLALVASQNETNREHSRILLSLSEQMKELDEEVFGLLEIKTPPRKK